MIDIAEGNGYDTGKKWAKEALNAEEKPELDPEASERDRDLPPLPSPAVGVRAMARYRRQGVQDSRSLCEEAYEAGHQDGYGDGYIDGYDDGRYNQLISVIRLLQEELEHGP